MELEVIPDPDGKFVLACEPGQIQIQIHDER